MLQVLPGSKDRSFCALPLHVPKYYNTSVLGLLGIRNDLGTVSLFSQALVRYAELVRGARVLRPRSGFLGALADPKASSDKTPSSANWGLFREPRVSGKPELTAVVLPGYNKASLVQWILVLGLWAVVRVVKAQSISVVTLAQETGREVSRLPPLDLPDRLLVLGVDGQDL